MKDLRWLDKAFLLEGALAASGVKVDGKTCLDVGQGQLHSSLREHAQVLGLEQINARDLIASDLIAAYSDWTRARGAFEGENEGRTQTPSAALSLTTKGVLHARQH